MPIDVTPLSMTSAHAQPARVRPAAAAQRQLARARQIARAATSTCSTPTASPARTSCTSCFAPMSMVLTTNRRGDPSTTPRSAVGRRTCRCGCSRGRRRRRPAPRPGRPPTPSRSRSRRTRRRLRATSSRSAARLCYWRRRSPRYSVAPRQHRIAVPRRAFPLARLNIGATSHMPRARRKALRAQAFPARPVPKLTNLASGRGGAGRLLGQANKGGPAREDTVHAPSPSPAGSRRV